METNNQQQQQPRRRSMAPMYIAVALLLFFLIAWSTGACAPSGPQRRNFSVFTQHMGYYIDSDGNHAFRVTKEGTASNQTLVLDNNLRIMNNTVVSVIQEGNNFHVQLRDGSEYYFHIYAFHNVVSILQAFNGFIEYLSQSDYLQSHVSTSTLPNLPGTPANTTNTILTYLDTYVTNYAELDAFITARLVNVFAGFTRPDNWDILNLNDRKDLVESHIETRWEADVRARFANANRITIDAREVPSSWFSFGNILYLLMIIIFGVFAFFMIRSFSSRGGLGNMGKNRANHTMGGNIRFSDVAGIEEEKEEVQEIVQFLKNPKKFLELGARIPKGVLLVGSPGTGKTLLAKAIAGEAGVHFFSISGSDFSEMLVGVGPSRMRDLFETAKLNAPAIIFIDEIDSIARMRGVGVSGVSDENEQTLNQLLVQMDGFTKSEGVIVIAATNRPDVLDQALLRPGRFDRQIVVQVPDVKGREQILHVHAKNKPIGDDVDLKRVAQIISGFSGADIENLLNEAAIIAAKKDKKKINMADITEGINKVLLGPQKKSRIITEEDKKITAYHEAGHAIISAILQPDQVVQEVSIIPRGMAAGYTLTNEKDIQSHHKSKKWLTARLAMLLGGRVAEQQFIGDICTGSSNDLKVATDLASRMVTEFGMSDKLGPLYYGEEEEMALRLYKAQNPRSENLQALIDGEIKSLILNAEKQAQEILKSQKAKVDIMSNVLLERETIYASDIDLIMKGKKEKEVVAEIEKRDQASKAQEKKDKIDADVEILNRDLEHILKHSQRFVDAKLATPEKLEQLKGNMELAREVIRNGGTLSQLPTFDNLEEYAKIIAEAQSDADVKEQAPEDKPTAKPAPRKKAAPKKPTEEKDDK